MCQLAAMDSDPTPNATALMQLLQCNFVEETLESINSKPKKSTRSARLGGGTDSESICKAVDDEDVGP